MTDLNLTPKEALELTIEGFDDYALDAIFYRPFFTKYEESRTKAHEHSIDIILNKQHYYFYDTKVIGNTPTICALQRMAYTVGLMVGLHDLSGLVNYTYRYCYPTLRDAYEALQEWDGEGHPPGNWIKRKGEGGDLRNPKIEDKFG